MDEFVAFSKSSQESLKMATLSSSLPLNTVILGEKAVGKSYLASVVASSAKTYEAEDIENLLIKNTFDFNSCKEVIVYNIHKLSSTKNIIDRFEKYNIKVVATSIYEKPIYDKLFQVKILVPPLKERPEDVDFLISKYIKEAKRLFLIEDEISDIDIDLSNNAISLKKSIFRAILFDSLTKEHIMELMETFFEKEFKQTTKYKQLLPIFEIPLLKAGQKVFKSQLQMAKRFDINRNTLRKKLSENNLDG